MMFALCVCYQVGTPWLDSLSIPTIGSSLYSAMLPFRMVRAFDHQYVARQMYTCVSNVYAQVVFFITPTRLTYLGERRILFKEVVKRSKHMPC